MDSETVSPEEKKPILAEINKSSMEILSELFSTFDAEPPVIIKKEKSDESNKKHKKSKKKHKHKDKKHKKKDKKRKRDHSSSSDGCELDLAQILIKQEKEASEKKIKIEGTTLEFDFSIQKLKKEPGEHVEDSSETLEARTSQPEKNHIKDLKFSSVLDSNSKPKLKTEDGEVSTDVCDSDTSDKLNVKNKPKKRHKHKSDHDKKRLKRSSSKTKEKPKLDDLRSKLKEKEKQIREREARRSSRERERGTSDSSKEKYRDHRNRDRYKEEFKIRDYERELDDYKARRSNPFYKEESFYPREKEDDKWFMRERYRGYSERERPDRRYRSPSTRDSSYIDKKKLLEIARKNAIQMMKSGSLPGALTLGPQAQEKVIAAIKAGGKTIEELTDFCKTLSKKEETGDLSSCSDKGNSSDSDADKPFHHPFQIKDRPTSITMNIKNSVPLPIKSSQEKTCELRMQFPVSSGQQHRKTENEWVPVPPKKSESKSSASTASGDSAPLAIEASKEPVVVPAPPNAPPGPQAFPTPVLEMTVDIGSIVSQRLTAMRRLQENPNDVQALTQMYKSNKEMQSWAQSKQQPGQFTGSTGANILSQAELSSGYQAWAKKDQLQLAAPVSGGMGMHLLQKMGWRPGEGLGKEKTGTLEPLLLEVKLDKKGLVANEEQKKKRQKLGQPTVKTLQGKHPVSLLGEYASKKKLGAPQYILCFESGPDHKKNFLFKVVLNGEEYQPSVASGNKKEAKAAAASVCLKHIGLLV